MPRFLNARHATRSDVSEGLEIAFLEVDMISHPFLFFRYHVRVLQVGDTERPKPEPSALAFTEVSTVRLYPAAQDFSNSSRYWLVRSVTIASSGLSLRPKTSSTFEELERPGLDFFAWELESWPDLTASGNFVAAILLMSSHEMSTCVS